MMNQNDTPPYPSFCFFVIVYLFNLRPLSLGCYFLINMYHPDLYIRVINTPRIPYAV